MVRRKGKCPKWSRLESLVRAKLLVRLSPLSTLSTKFGSITFCFSLWAAASTVTKKMLIPDSLASLEASSTRSVGQPSTITTTTLGAPPRFPLASKKKFLLTNESAFPAIEEELRRSYRSGSTLSDNIPWNSMQRADSSVGGCRELGESSFCGCVSRRGDHCYWCQCFLTSPALNSLPMPQRGWGWWAGLSRIPKALMGTGHKETDLSNQLVMDLQCLGSTHVGHGGSSALSPAWP